MGIGRLSDGLAPTPPMGWNSWNRFQGNIDERLVIETAEAIVATGLRDAGYRYVVVDDGWMAPERDRRGDIVPDPARFPHGIAAVAERVHALGLRFGLYTDAGTKTCMGLPASLGYEFRDARRFAEWGVDYLKVDWCHTSGMGPRTLYAKWAMALHATGRPIVFSVCEWGRARPWEWAGSLAHLWRTTWDIQPDWTSVTTILDKQAELHRYSGPDHWNDPDMLEVGNGALTSEENRAHFALWAMCAAPLMAGNDIRAMSEEVQAVLTASEIIAVDQDPLGLQGRRLKRENGCEVWLRELADGGRVVAALNRGSGRHEIAVGLGELGIGGRARVRDLWQRADRAPANGDLVVEAGPHSATVLRIAPY
jgi:alpha-galactosidase